MGCVITGPGFYTSKAGKCEVKWCDDEYAFGYDVNRNCRVWDCQSGWAFDARNHDITGPWTDKPKPIEMWRVCWGNGYYQNFNHKTNAEGYMEGLSSARLVHLIEAEDRG